jgi:hypothetical protein
MSKPSSKARYVVCGSCIDERRDAWVYLNKLHLHPTCKHCARPYPDPQKRRKAAGPGQLGHEAPTAGGTHVADIAKKMRAEIMAELKAAHDAGPDALRALLEAEALSSQHKQPTLGERSKARKDTQYKVSIIVKKLAAKREEIALLEEECIEAMEKAEAAEQAYTDAIRSEHEAVVSEKEGEQLGTGSLFPGADIEAAMKVLDKDQTQALQKQLDSLAKAQAEVAGLLRIASAATTSVPATEGTDGSGDALMADVPTGGAAGSGAPGPSIGKGKGHGSGAPSAGEASTAPDDAAHQQRLKDEKSRMTELFEKRKKEKRDQDEKQSERAKEIIEQAKRQAEVAAAAGAAPSGARQ